ncbi:MAG: tRNA threonylcarbamoyladenosine dehydratase [Bacteroidales bacterium]|nr:tRNA threonylcarbamoyladenosine dehydratase [Bacteroidales bacterium]
MSDRTERLPGSDAMAIIRQKKVIIFGVGGVGSWCAESLVRSGFRHITLVDSDCVSLSNINRQLMATTTTVGKAKVEVLGERLLTINPNAEIEAKLQIYYAETAASFHIENYDYVVDAIDSLQNKAQLILHATSVNVKFFSSMGAALKLDPRGVQVAEFWNVKGCPLGKALRKKFKYTRQLPKRKFLCVYDEEVLENKGNGYTPQGETATSDEFHNWNAEKAQINGSLVHITGIFGLTLAGLIMQDAVNVKA